MKRRSISKRVRFAVFERDGFRCRYCGATAPDVKLHIDHVFPVSRGGGNGMGNLVSACEDCNLGKADLELRPIIKRMYEFSMAALMFGRAVEKFGDDLRLSDFSLVEDFCLSEQNLPALARMLDAADTWEDARAGWYDITGHPAQ